MEYFRQIDIMRKYTYSLIDEKNILTVLIAEMQLIRYNIFWNPVS